jgi:hypothetical protein
MGKFVDSNVSLDYALLSDSYLESATIILEHQEINNDHSLVLPGIYLLKHALELSFKNVLKFNFKVVEDRYLHTHNLKEIKKIFIDKSLKLQEENKKTWDDIKKDRLVGFSDFIENLNKDIDSFLEKSSFLKNDKLNQEQRFPFGEYPEPTIEIIDIFFKRREYLLDLAMKINNDIDIIFDFVLRIEKNKPEIISSS